MNYILDDDGNPVPEPDVRKWATWFEKSKRRLALDLIGPFKVSTVFLGIDHNVDGSGPPVLWETMIFARGTELHEYQERYSTKADALVGHATALGLLIMLTKSPL